MRTGERPDPGVDTVANHGVFEPAGAFADDRTFPLTEPDAAIRYLETGRARDKVAVVVP